MCLGFASSTQVRLCWQLPLPPLQSPLGLVSLQLIVFNRDGLHHLTIVIIYLPFFKLPKILIFSARIVSSARKLSQELLFFFSFSCARLPSIPSSNESQVAKLIATHNNSPAVALQSAQFRPTE